MDRAKSLPLRWLRPNLGWILHAKRRKLSSDLIRSDEPQKTLGGHVALANTQPQGLVSDFTARFGQTVRLERTV